MSKVASRRAVLAGIAAAPAVAVPALALAGERDPVFAAIERHRAVAAVLDAIIHEQSVLEASIPHEKRKAFILGDDASSDDPRWRDHYRRYWAATDQLDEANQQLFEAPRSLAGLAVLANYMDEAREQGNGSWDDAWPLPEPDDMLTNLVALIRRMGVTP